MDRHYDHFEVVLQETGFEVFHNLNAMCKEIYNTEASFCSCEGGNSTTAPTMNITDALMITNIIDCRPTTCYCGFNSESAFVDFDFKWFMHLMGVDEFRTWGTFKLTRSLG